jgi:hypothetical protein
MAAGGKGVPDLIYGINRLALYIEIAQTHLPGFSRREPQAPQTA